MSYSNKSTIFKNWTVWHTLWIIGFVCVLFLYGADFPSWFFVGGSACVIMDMRYNYKRKEDWEE